jgi:predicted transcriptional regulator
MYTDPDVKDVNDPLSDAIKAKNFPGAKYAAVGIANCKVTWIPDAGIRAASKKKQQQFKDSTIMLDTNKALATAWQLGDCNGAGVVIIVGKDKKIKYINYVKSPAASKAAINEAIPIIEAEIKK